MGIDFTAEQKRVIDLRGRNILVSAAAGSGKTAVLTERIVKMISDEEQPVDIDRLLVVTFTNAAAAEMRERIARAIEARLEAAGDNGHLQKQATLIHNAQITTIDSFCLFVIRNNFNDIGLDPGFRVADEGEIRLLTQDVMQKLLEERFAAGDSGFLSCVEYFSTGSSDKAIEEYILKLYQFAESHPWPEEWLEARKADYDIPGLEQMEEMPFISYAMEQARRLAEDCLAKNRDCLAICGQPDGPYMYGTVLEEEGQKLEALLKLTGYAEGYALFHSMAFGRLPSKKDDSVSPNKRSVVQELRKGIKDTIKGICSKYFPIPPQKALEYMQGSREAVCELVDLALDFKAALDRRKREENILDFGDMEHLALSILVQKGEDGSERPTRTALDYREYFHEILIDEYQDSNLVQEKLLQSISKDGDDAFNRFMVGDVKQSIYKFRLARPELFMEKYESYEADEEVDAKRQRIDLHKNFRSRREVVESVNFLFGRIMGRELGGIDYDEKAALYPAAVYPEQEEKEGLPVNITELLLVKKEEEEEALEGEGMGGAEGTYPPPDWAAASDKKLSDRQKEAYAVACRMKELVGSFPVTDKETGRLRPAEYRDMVILLRTTAGWDEDFKSMLKEAGIPSHVTSRTGYFAAKEIQALLQLLRILDNPQQDIPLYGVMRSFFGGFTDREIALLRAFAGDRKKTLYFCLKEPGEEEGQLRKKAEDFLAFLEAYRDKAVYMSIHELLQEILIQTGYLNYVSALPAGEQRRANVQMLLEKAADFEKTSYYGLFHFIRYIEQLEKYDVDYGEANILDENADVVRIMSIHKSKGLEFPICFVCGLSKRFNMQDTGGKLIADVDMGIGVDYVDSLNRFQTSTIRKNVLGEKMRLDNLGEELRILYVALTRAKEKLIMTGMVRKPEKRLGMLIPQAMRKGQRLLYGELAGAGSYLDFILPAFVQDPSFEGLWEQYGLEAPKKYEGRPTIAVRIVEGQDFLEAEVKEQAKQESAKRQLELSDPLADMDHGLMTYVSDLFSYRYPYWNLADLYTKTTVSELKKAKDAEEKDFSFRLYEEETVIPYIPRFMLGEESLGGAGRGSAFHKVMELLELGEGAESVEQQIGRMVETGRLSREYAMAVSVPAVEAFLQSGLARRMREAEKSGCLYREQPFVLGLPASELKETFPAEELVLIQGIIDVYFEEDGGLVVADYKTDRVESARELADRYQKQLDYYGRALTEITGKRVKEKVIYSFGLGEEILL